MPDKNIGFYRTVFRNWLDETASRRVQELDTKDLRAQLENILQSTLSGKNARRQTIDVLFGFWGKSAQVAPHLFDKACQLYQNAYTSDDFLWLHYGLGLIYYPIFRYVTATIGQMARLEETMTRKQIKERVIAEWGHLGAMDRSIERICASLTEWGLFPAAEKRGTYRPMRNALHTENIELQTWLLACALFAHPADSLLFNDLLRLPELFPFDLSALGADTLRTAPWFVLYNEVGWMRVELVHPLPADAPSSNK